MRVLLVYSNRMRILEPAPPIGLAYVATAAARAGHEVRFVDLMVSAEPHAELRRAVTEFQPTVVGFSVRNIDNVVAQQVASHLDELTELISIVRKASAATIVLGGPAVSILGASALERFDADFAIVGEGDVSFPQLLAELSGPQNFASVPGLCYRNCQGVISVPPVREERFADSGMERWVRWRAYEAVGGTWAIHTKRGCPLACVYCNYPVMEGHRLRRRAAAEVVDEIEHVVRTVGPRTFEFTDSTFNIPESHAAAICEEILRRNLKLNLSAVGINPAGVSPELFQLMRRAGFISLVITPDSASDRMLTCLRKGFAAEQVRLTADLARASGIRCTWFFLFGGPGETRETVEETLSFIETQLNWKRFLTIAMTGIRILPGTPLATLAREEGLLSDGWDFMKPTFYFSPDADEQWVLDRITKSIARCPTLVHGAEQNGSGAERGFYQALNHLGVPPPYYRFLPVFLRTPPLPWLRARHANIRASGARATTRATS